MLIRFLGSESINAYTAHDSTHFSSTQSKATTKIRRKPCLIFLLVQRAVGEVLLDLQLVGDISQLDPHH